MAEICIVAGVILLFIGFIGLTLWWDASLIEQARARGEEPSEPSMWP